MREMLRRKQRIPAKWGGQRQRYSHYFQVRTKCWNGAGVPVSRHDKSLMSGHHEALGQTGPIITKRVSAVRDKCHKLVRFHTMVDYHINLSPPGKKRPVQCESIHVVRMRIGKARNIFGNLRISLRCEQVDGERAKGRRQRIEKL